MHNREQSDIEAQVKELDIPIGASIIAAGLPDGTKSVMVGKYRAAYVEGVTKSLDKEKLARYLVEEAGVPAEVVVKAFLFCTRETQKGYTTVADTSKERKRKK